MLTRILNAEWALRVCLGVMYLYSGSDLVFAPEHWYGYIPAWFSQMIAPLMTTNSYLHLQGAAEIIIGLLLLTWFVHGRFVQIATIAATLEMALILIFVGVNLVTFRDVGLLGATLALLFLYNEK